MRPSKSSRRILREIETYRLEHDGISPSVRDLCEATGLTINAISFHLHKLEQADEIKVRPGIHRGIVPTRQGMPLLELSDIEDAFNS